MARRAIVLLASLLLLGTSGCYVYFGYGYGYGDDCWYDDDGNLWCADAFHAAATRTQGGGHPVASHEVLSLVNDERTAVGLEPLALSETVARVATEQAQDMDVEDVLEAKAPIAVSVPERLAELGVEAPRWNHAYYTGEVDPEDVVEAWMADASSRLAILDPALDAAGVGVHAINGMRWWSIVFVGP